MRQILNTVNSDDNAVAGSGLGLREQNRRSLMERILDAAREAFMTHGLNDADLADIAQRAKIGRATLYRYFSRKDALVAALLDEDWRRQAVLFQRLVDKPVLDQEVIAKWLHALVRAMAARLTLFPIYFTAGKDIDMMARLSDQRERLIAILGARFRGFLAKSELGGISGERIEGLLLLFQIEQFAGHAAGAKDVNEIEHGVQVIAAQLAGRLVDEKRPEPAPRPAAKRPGKARAASRKSYPVKRIR